MFENKALAVSTQKILSLLANPNRGLNGSLGDVTVAIGGF